MRNQHAPSVRVVGRGKWLPESKRGVPSKKKKSEDCDRRPKPSSERATTKEKSMEATNPPAEVLCFSDLDLDWTDDALPLFLDEGDFVDPPGEPLSCPAAEGKVLQEIPEDFTAYKPLAVGQAPLYAVAGRPGPSVSWTTRVHKPCGASET